VSIGQVAAALAERYRPDRELGRGGMATVYLAEDLKHGRMVALKVLRPELAAVLGPDRFLNEIRITASLDHPHIVTLLDSGTSAGLLWYVLPYIRGESLRDRLIRDKQIGVAEALEITRQIAGALDFAHQRGVIHRDVKPENILLHEGEAMLADFGIALAVKEAGGNRLTETGISLGTPAYMSPEQATGDRQPDARSDLYSLAAVLYEMLAGEPPHTGATAQAVIAKLMTERPTRLRIVRDTVPEGVDAAVARALSKVPADRFPSAGEFVRALSGAAPARRRLPGQVRGVVAVGLAGAAIVTAIGYTLTHRAPARLVQPDQLQLTSTGNARTPALSTDGRRLAYSTRHCNAEGYCTSDVVIQDLGGAGSSTALRAWASIWNLDWSGDGRYLLVNGAPVSGRIGGVFSVPALGGEPRLLGNVPNDFASMVGNSDTVLAYRIIAADTTWLRWITIADGMTRDSLPIPRRAGEAHSAWPFPDGRRFLLVRSEGAAGWVATVMDREGRAYDSLRSKGLFSNVIGLTRDGRLLLVQVWSQGPHDNFDVVAYRMSSTRRIDTRPDTVLRQLHGEAWSAPNGALLLAAGPVQRELWAMRRDGSASMHFTQRRVATATSELTGVVSPAGDRILIERLELQGDKTRRQYSIMPLEGGPETSVATPTDALAAFWSPDGHEIITFRVEGDSLHLLATDLATGNARPFGTLWTGNMGSGPHLLSGGGLVVSNRVPSGLRRFGVPGLPDTVFGMAESPFGFVVAASPDGRDAARLGFAPDNSEMVLDRISLLDGSATRLASVRAEGARQTYWLSDGSLVLQLVESSSSLVWFRVPDTGGRPVRLGTPPHYPAEYSISLDGREVVASVRADLPDIYLIRNFQELLGP
jgi:eukaryotic-like serine/threonine-protein kinase